MELLEKQRGRHHAFPQGHRTASVQMAHCYGTLSYLLGSQALDCSAQISPVPGLVIECLVDHR
jgi:hypothetical protein